MAGFGDIGASIVSTFTDFASDIAAAFGFGEEDDTANKTWSIDGTDWYKIYPYQFVIRRRGEDPTAEPTSVAIYALPIPPQSLTIQAIPASQATPTMGGVVEETNTNVFWNISLVGTTGAASSRKPDAVSSKGEPSFNNSAKIEFRDKIATTGLLSGVASQLNAGINQIGGAIDGGIAAVNSFASGDITGGISNAVGALTNAVLPPLPYSSSGVPQENNGFTEAHWLQYFFYRYSAMKAKDPDGVFLEFRILQTQKKWQIATPTLTISKNAQNPMLYRYQINMKAWDIKNTTELERSKTEFDRFAPGGDLAAVNTVGLGVLTLMSEVIGSFAEDIF